MKLIALFAAVSLSAIGCSKPAPVAVVDSYCLVKYHNIPSDPEIVCQGENTAAMQSELVKFKRGIAEQADVEDYGNAADDPEEGVHWVKTKKRITHRITATGESVTRGKGADDSKVEPKQ